MTSARALDSALAGCTIIVAGDRRSVELTTELERHGAVVHRAPDLSMIAETDDDELRARTERVIAEPPDVVVVTTGVGFRGWMLAAREQGLDTHLEEALRGARFVARGPQAREAIEQAGFTAEWAARSETSAEIGEYLPAAVVAGKRVLVQHHGAGSDALDEQLADAGADVLSVTVYRWRPPPAADAVRRSAVRAAGGEADAVLFTSAPGAAAWISVAEHAGVFDHVRRRSHGDRLLLAAVGPIAAAPLHAADLRATVPDRGRLDDLARTVIEHFGRGRAPSLPTDAGRVEVRSGGVVVDGAFLPLSRSAAALLEALAAAGGRVLSRAELGSVLGGERNPHAVEVAVARLREALGGRELVHTVVKRGYRLAVTEI